MNNARTRVDRVVSWIGWHVGELAGVAVPGAVALWVTPWAAVLSGVVGAAWALHEIRLARQQPETAARNDGLTIKAAKSEVDAPDAAAGWGGSR